MALLSLLLLVGQAAGAQPVPVPEAETLASRPDAIRRMTLPVMIDGRGPFDFVVDTGAERTVISRQLAEALQLTPGRQVRLATIADVRQVPTVLIPRLAFGRQTVDRIQAPVLEAQNLGADGMLGIDSLANRQLVLDFRRREVHLTRALNERMERQEGTIVVVGRTRLGRLVLTDAAVDGQNVTVIVDTGSPVSIGNSALRDRLGAAGGLPPPELVKLLSVTGVEVSVAATLTRRMRIGDAGVRDLPIAFADLALFREMGIERQPALLLGMDVLQLFERVVIDFPRRRLRLMPGPRSEARPQLRVATVQ